MSQRMQNLALDLEKYHDPYCFTDMKIAVDRIETAITKNEKIIIFGDYDVDGISGTALLYKELEQLGANVSYRIPNRMKHGYGLTMPFVEEFIEKKIDLVITVDCGISCTKEVAEAGKHGIDIIITDHHTIPEAIPQAVAIIHPKYDNQYPYRELTGSGVAFKLAHGLIQRLMPKDAEETQLKELVDLASLGTVADMGPLSGENRHIVKQGLLTLSNTQWPGLKQLLINSGIDLERDPTAGDIGFKIGPRINAAGRIDDPYIALQLLLQNETSRITELGNALEKINIKRIEMLEEALASASLEIESLSEIPPIIILENSDWHVGILGLIASRISDKYHRPTVILQVFEEFLTASARSPEYFNIIEALTHNSQYLETFGGHHCAAGFKVKKEKYPEFKSSLTDYSRKTITEIPQPVIKIDCEISPDELDLQFEKEISKLAPFGIGNSRPKLLLTGISPQFPQAIGKDNKHLKFTAQIGNKTFNTIAFNMGEHLETIKGESTIDLVFSPEANNWRGNTSLQLQIHDIRVNEQPTHL